MTGKAFGMSHRVPQRWARLLVCVTLAGSGLAGCGGPAADPPPATATNTSTDTAGTTAPVAPTETTLLGPPTVVSGASAAGSVTAPTDGLGPSPSTSVAAAEGGLPGGGRVWFPGHRLVALYGHPDIAGLGALGEQDLPASVARAAALAGQYRPLSDVPVVPTFEIIASYADSVPGDDGNYSAETPAEQLRPWVQAAGAAGMAVLLDLQPGRSDFLSQAKLYTDLLTLPYVGLAVDPEWRLGPNQLPLQQIGSVDAAEVNTVIDWLARLTAAHRLPQKLLVLHQFRLSMLGHENQITTDRGEVAVLIHMDGQGDPQLKDETWQAVTGAAPAGVPFGWKNFYRNDTPMLTPAQTMTKNPTPLMISYE